VSIIVADDLFRPALLHLPERGKSWMQIIRDMFGPGHSPLVSGAFFMRRFMRASLRSRNIVIGVFLRVAVPTSLETLRPAFVASQLGGVNFHRTAAVFPPRPCLPRR